jgi:CRISPR-associated endonuclease Cas3-HD
MNKSPELLANSAGHTLRDHSIAVSKVSYWIAKHVLKLTEDLCEAARLSGLYHDIGKAIKEFQDFLMKIMDGESFVYHHELSWAIISLFSGELLGSLKPRSTLLPYEKANLNKIVRSAVYWHHAQPYEYKGDGEFGPVRSAINKIICFSEHDPACDKSKRQVEEILAFVRSLAPTYDSTESIPVTEPTPKMYEESTDNSNPRSMCVRACIIGADRRVSSLSPEQVAEISNSDSDDIPDMCKAWFDDITNDCRTGLALPVGYSKERWDLQGECVSKVSEAWNDNVSTVAVNAPGGFGKTSVGVRTHLHRGRRMFWIVPRNMIAISVFDSIIKELIAVDSSASVELYLGGRREDCRPGGEMLIPFTSDIVVTNLDNYLKRAIDNGDQEDLYKVLSSDAVFDEYHEFPRCGALYPLFLTTLRARHVLTGAKTLLLSATGHSVPCELWDSASAKNTVYLPSRYEHYAPAHSEPYLVSISERLPETLQVGDASIHNSVEATQVLYRARGADMCVHSRFTVNDSQKPREAVMRLFGKGGSRNARVSSAPVIQASLDVSFFNVSSSVSDAEDDMQRFARDNRWGDLLGIHRFIFCFPTGAISKNEDAAANLLAPAPIRNAWKKFVREHFTDEVTINISQMYVLYNKFSKRIIKLTLEYRRSEEKALLEDLSSYFPVKRPKPKLKPSSKKAKVSKPGTGRKMSTEGNIRNPSGSFYIAARNPDGSIYGGEGDVIAVEAYEFEDIFNSCAITYYMLGILVDHLADRFSGYKWLMKDRKSFQKKGDSLVPFKFWKNLCRSADLPFPSKYMYKIINPNDRTDPGFLGEGLVRVK